MDPHGQPAQSVDDTILRFHRAERVIHWAVAGPFMVCYLTALVLVLVYNPDPSRPYRAIFSWTHRISGVSLFVLPAVAILTHPRDWRLHLGNIIAAWLWSWEDFKWLLLKGLSVLSRRIHLPEAGKFNAAEKLNFMMVMTASPLFVVTGTLIWLPGVASFYFWVIHFVLAGVVTPLMLGHIFMATVNPSTRVGLKGMVSGHVDREWAAHHYPKWYRTHFGEAEQVGTRDWYRTRFGDSSMAATAEESPEPDTPPEQEPRDAAQGGQGG